jgi:hypothetical protein
MTIPSPWALTVYFGLRGGERRALFVCFRCRLRVERLAMLSIRHGGAGFAAWQIYRCPIDLSSVGVWPIADRVL